MENNIDKILESIKELRESQKETDKQIKETSRQIKEMSREMKESRMATDRQIKEMSREMKESRKENDRQMKNLRRELGSIGLNNGAFAEELFFRSLEDNPVLGGIKYDRVKKKVIMDEDDIEYDIILINGQCVAVIEVKYKAHPDEIKSIVKAKTANFRNTFSKYKDHKLYFGIASLVTNSALEQSAKEEGIYLLTQKGEHMEIVNNEVRGY